MQDKKESAESKDKGKGSNKKESESSEEKKTPKDSKKNYSNDDDNGQAGYMKDISRINQDIENIKQ